jgi:simple sugar transport system ATP-binding protein
VVANDGVDLAVLPGEIHAVLGENGAAVDADEDHLRRHPADEEIPGRAGRSPWRIRHARNLGIGCVPAFSLFETLTVVENVALRCRARSNEASPQIVASRSGRLPVDPQRLVHALGPSASVEVLAACRSRRSC